MTPWWQGRMLALDLETTGTDPFDARIVTAAVALIGGNQPTETRTWLADPGVEIPEQATEVHGVTTEHAREHGRPRYEVTAEILEVLANACETMCPVVIFNAPYDLTVLESERARMAADGLPGLDEFARLTAWEIMAVDPRPLDQFLDKFRRSYPNAPRGMGAEDAQAAGHISTRTLEGMCGVYGATLDGAHDAAFDALAAGRLAYRIGQRGEVLRNVRNAQDGRELAALKREWEAVRHDLPALVDFQRRHALAERPRFAEYKRAEAAKLMAVDPDRAAEALAVAGRVELERGWPVLEPLEVTP